jgi:hypothetical protein
LEIHDLGYKVVDKEGNEYSPWGTLDDAEPQYELKKAEIPYQLDIDFPKEFKFISPGVPFKQVDICGIGCKDIIERHDENIMKGKIVDDKGVLSVRPMTQFNG